LGYLRGFLLVQCQQHEFQIEEAIIQLGPDWAKTNMVTGGNLIRVGPFWDRGGDFPYLLGI
jgi:hypothetical protein|tara:strand:- start:1093 stop:1275 length:183 start_codon:yes stop_codon:yes gene_type:complete